MYWVIDFSAATLLVIVFLQWHATIRLYGQFPVTLIPITIRYAFKTPKAFLFVAGIAAIAGALLPDHFPPFLVPLTVMLGIVALSNVSLPPAVLLLASSTTATSQLVWEGGLAVFPLRLVHLIQPSLRDIDALSGDMFAQDSLRTISDSAWRSVVHPLMDSVPIVVIDTRIRSPAIVEEIARMLDPSRRKKAIFIIGNDGSRPGIDAVIGPNRQPSIRCVTFDQLPTLLRSLTRRKILQSKAIFEDKDFGFLISIPRHWNKVNLTTPSPRNGVRIAVRNKDGATLSVSCGDPNPHTPQDRNERTRYLFNMLASSCAQNVVKHTAFAPALNDVNLASAQILQSQGAYGLMSIIRNDIEYTIQYVIPTSAPFSTIEEVYDLVLSLRFSDQPDTPLFRDPDIG